ncbi:MAG: PHP domain-containing protein [Salinivenus sp.]
MDRPDRDSDQTPVFADLHTHTSRSDGMLSPSDLVEKAADRGLCVLSVTDHDTVAGVEAATHAAAEEGLTLLPGVELSVTLNGSELHLLAYAFDPSHAGLQSYLREMQAARRRRAWKMVERLRAHGLEVEDEQLRSVIDTTAAAGRPHLASALVRAGHVSSIGEAFDRYLGRDGPGFVAKPEVPAADALTVVHEAGGVGVLAHPGHWTSSADVRALCAAGLDGLELYHRSHGASLRRYYRRLAESYDLLVTGGSDYHGREEAEETHLGTIGLNERNWERFRAAVA